MTSPTKGWHRQSPKTTKERRRMLKKCGSKCFLKPRSLGYPICPKGRCSPSKKGLEAAYIRARQFKHQSIASKAKRKLKRSRRRRSPRNRRSRSRMNRRSRSRMNRRRRSRVKSRRRSRRRKSRRNRRSRSRRKSRRKSRRNRRSRSRRKSRRRSRY